MLRLSLVLVCAVTLGLAGVSVSFESPGAATVLSEQEPNARFATRLNSDCGSEPVSGTSLPLDAGVWVDTLHWDGPVHQAIGLRDGGTFFGAARFTPDDDYVLTNVLWYNYNVPANAAVYIWGPGTASRPGALIDSVVSSSGEMSWIDVATPAVELPAGQDFWVGVRVTHDVGTYPLNTDNGPQIVQRGGFISMDGVEWDELYQLGLDVNFNIRAVVEAEKFDNDVGVTMILAPTGKMTPGTVRPQVRIRNLGMVPQSNIPVHISIELGGTEVYSAEAMYTGSLAPRATANISFSPDWAAPEGVFDVTGWTALAGDEDPMNDTARTTLLVAELVVDTLHWDGENSGAVGHNHGGPFIGAVRFTPEQRYTLTNVLWYNRNAAYTAEIRIYGHMFRNFPGDLLVSLESPVGDESWINVPTPALVMPPGRDFWVGIRLTHNPAIHPLGVDAGPLVPMRNFISEHGTRWQELPDVGLRYNWNIRAVVEFRGAGVESEEPVPGQPYFLIGPNPLNGGFATLRFEGLGHNPESRKDLGYVPRLTLTVFDVTGRSVLNRNMPAVQAGTISLDLRDLSAGVYLVKLETEGFSGTRKLVIQ